MNRARFRTILFGAALGICSPVAAVAQIPADSELANATYRGVYDEPVRLEDGSWEGDPFVPGGASRPRVELVRDFVRTGDVNGDGRAEAVVLLSESSGGSGVQLYLALVGREDGDVTNLATVLVGDRVQVRRARVVTRGIELGLVQAGPEDAACCPSQTATRAWTWEEAGLKELPIEITGTFSLQDLSGEVWILKYLDWDDAAPPQPEVTLTVEGNRLSGTSGCNRYFADVSGSEPGELTVGPIGATRMACSEDAMALEQRYLEKLGAVVRYSFLAGQLALTSTANGVMLFDPAP